jgi:hypothetical protein
MGHAAVALQHQGAPLVFFFGGQQGRKLLAKLFSLTQHSTDGTWTWARHNIADMPSPRAGHAMVAVQRGVHGAYLFGGQGKKMLNDLHHLTMDERGMPSFHVVTARGRAPSPRCAAARCGHL